MTIVGASRLRPDVHGATGDFRHSAAPDVLRYSQVWEDHLLLEAGLAVGPGDDVLCIGSGGCNALALLLCEPRSVVAVDVSLAQAALIELKLAAVRCLTHEQFGQVLGAVGHGDRLMLYRRVRGEMPLWARAFWDDRRDDVRAGVIHRGRLEAYMNRFRTQHVERLIDQGAVETLLNMVDPAAQRDLFDSCIATPEFRRAFAGFLSRESITAQARDASQFRYVGGVDVAAHFWRRFRWVCTQVPARGNFYLEYLLTGGYRDLRSGPPYLRPASFARLRSLSDRLTTVHAEFSHMVAGSDVSRFSKANLSNMLEYHSETDADAVFALLGARMRPGGRVAYWNLLVPRRSPPSLRGCLQPLTGRASTLARHDRSWFYRAFGVEEVTRDGP